jgi:4-amino-4-deoxy-L-arabinose transferase-like glycosyltransferase
MASKFSGFFKRYWLDIVLILFILATSPLFFYKLGQSSLVSWDEGWYAGIAANILKTGDFLRLFWNGKPFFDHPAAGFWWMAISFKFLGITNFAARFPSAIFGISTLVFVYFLGKELFNKWVGFASAIALVSAPWFIYRARSGDLDVFLTFFFVFSVWLAIKSATQKKYLVPLGISLALLFLTKTLIPLAIIPALVIIFWGKKVNKKNILFVIVPFLVIVGIWFIAQLTLGMSFIARYFVVGLPGVTVKTSFLSNLILVKDYIHEGIGRWFWPSSAAVLIGLLFRKKSFYILGAFCLTFAVPFVFSNKTQIWHLIPLYPFMLLALFGVGYYIIEFVTKNKIVPVVVILAISLYFSFTQSKSNWYSFINIPAYISDEQILSTEASKYNLPLFVDGDFVPTAIFYSGKETVQQTFVGDLTNIFNNNSSFLLITQQSRLNNEKISPKAYQVIKSDRDKILIIKK